MRCRRFLAVLLCVSRKAEYCGLRSEFAPVRTSGGWHDQPCVLATLPTSSLCIRCKASETQYRWLVRRLHHCEHHALRYLSSFVRPHRDQLASLSLSMHLLRGTALRRTVNVLQMHHAQLIVRRALRCIFHSAFECVASLDTWNSYYIFCRIRHSLLRTSDPSHLYFGGRP